MFLHAHVGAQLFISQPTTGAGGTEYQFDSVGFKYVELTKTSQDYWLFEPVDIKSKPLNLVVFTHGYSAKNPGLYGAWLEHLVKKGNVVIFPRYQHNANTFSHKFTHNAVAGIKHAVAHLKSNTRYRTVNFNNVLYIGHSYGGVISTNMALKYKEFGIPKPKALMLCNAGTGGLGGGRYRYKKYAKMDTSIRVMIIIGEKDRVVQGQFPRKVFKQLKTTQKTFITLLKQKNDSVNITAFHNACLAPNKKYHSITNTVQVRKGFRIGKVSAVDYYCYWKIADELINCTFHTNNCPSYFNAHNKTIYMGNTSTKGAIVPLYIH